MNPDLDEYRIDQLTAEIVRRAKLFKEGKCPYCRHLLCTQETEIYCPQCKIGGNVTNLYYPGCLEYLRQVM